MKRLIITAILMTVATSAFALQEFWPTLFSSVTATASSAGYQTATVTTSQPTIVQLRTNAAGTYIIGTGTPTPIASAENVRIVLNGTVTFKLASSVANSKVFIQQGSNPVQY
jgi:uncharacterized protein YdeI (BOF family)